MRIQFCRKYSDKVVAEFEVATVPTREQCEAIEDELYALVGKWEDKNGEDIDDYDFWKCCHNALNHHIPIGENPVVKTFYTLI